MIPEYVRASYERCFVACAGNFNLFAHPTDTIYSRKNHLAGFAPVLGARAQAIGWEGAVPIHRLSLVSGDPGMLPVGESFCAGWVRFRDVVVLNEVRGELEMAIALRLALSKAEEQVGLAKLRASTMGGV